MVTEKDRVLYFYERGGKSFATPSLNIAIIRSETTEIVARTTDAAGQSSNKTIVVDKEA